MKFGRLFLGVVGSALIATSVNAADLPQAPTVAAPPPPPPPMAAPGFDWSGLYVGGYAGLLWDAGIDFVQLGAQAGFNIVRGALLAGIEGQVGAVLVLPGVGLEADINARLGAVLGQRVLLYGEAGVGIITGTPIWTAGGGIEVGLRQSLSVSAEAKALFTFPTTFQGVTVQLGMNFHPGN